MRRPRGQCSMRSWWSATMQTFWEWAGMRSRTRWPAAWLERRHPRAKHGDGGGAGYGRDGVREGGGRVRRGSRLGSERARDGGRARSRAVFASNALSACRRRGWDGGCAVVVRASRPCVRAIRRRAYGPSCVRTCVRHHHRHGAYASTCVLLSSFVSLSSFVHACRAYGLSSLSSQIKEMHLWRRMLTMTSCR